MAFSVVVRGRRVLLAVVAVQWILCCRFLIDDHCWRPARRHRVNCFVQRFGSCLHDLLSLCASRCDLFVRSLVSSNASRKFIRRSRISNRHNILSRS